MDTRLRLAQNRAWSNDTELLAQVVEMVSVVASEKSLKEPLKIPRPSWLSSAAAAAGAGTARGRNPYSDAITRMRAASRPQKR